MIGKTLSHYTVLEELTRGRYRTCRPSRRAGGKSTREAISSALAFCSFTCWADGRRSKAKAASTPSTPSCVTRPRRSPGLNGEEQQVLQPIIDRCLEKEPDKRYQSMALVLEDLKLARLRIASGRERDALETPRRCGGNGRYGGRGHHGVSPNRHPTPRQRARHHRSQCYISKICPAIQSSSGCGWVSPTCW